MFAEAERQRKKRGEKSLVALLGNAYYDVLDEDGDQKVSLPELKRMMNVFRVPEEAAYTFFLHADTVGYFDALRFFFQKNQILFPLKLDVLKIFAATRLKCS